MKDVESTLNYCDEHMKLTLCYFSLAFPFVSLETDYYSVKYWLNVLIGGELFEGDFCVAAQTAFKARNTQYIHCLLKFLVATAVTETWKCQFCSLYEPHCCMLVSIVT